MIQDDSEIVYLWSTHVKISIMFYFYSYKCSPIVIQSRKHGTNRNTSTNAHKSKCSIYVVEKVQWYTLKRVTFDQYSCPTKQTTLC
jgi:hypothetical protein